MPQITIHEQTILCQKGENLRRVLLRHRTQVYNGNASWFHCPGIGTCGTCAVEINGDVSPPTAIEKIRLSVPPHKPNSGLRLACQCTVQGDLVIQKHGGFWGQSKQSPPNAPEIRTPDP